MLPWQPVMDQCSIFNRDGWGGNKAPPRPHLNLLSLRFPTFISQICSGMWVEWLPFSLNWYVKHASVWYVIKFVLKPSLVTLQLSLRVGELLWPLVICKLKLSLSLFYRLMATWSVCWYKSELLLFFPPVVESLVDDSLVLWSASMWCTARIFSCITYYKHSVGSSLLAASYNEWVVAVLIGLSSRLTLISPSVREHVNS